MQPAKTIKSAAKVGWDTFEDLGASTAKPLIGETFKQFDALFGSPFGAKPKELAHDDLKRAREKKELEEKQKEDEKKSKEHIAHIQHSYSEFSQQQAREQKPLQQEMAALTQEVVQLAKAAGIETKVHLEQAPKKIGILHLRRLTAIIKTLRLKADEAKSGSELVSQRQNAKKGTGMMAWVSGKQMKIHEQGTLQLQG